MPFRVPSDGVILLAAEQSDAKSAALDHIYSLCGWVGMVLLIVGAVLQIIAAMLPPTKLG
jgi:hypothetical protein